MRVLAPADWLRALTDSACTWVVAIAGHTRVGADWALRERVQGEHWLGCLSDRQAVWGPPGGERLLGPGACLWYTPGLPHSLRPATPRRPFRFYHWRFRLIHDGHDLQPAPAARVQPERGGLLPLFAAAHAEWLTRQPLRSERTRLLLAAICADLLRLPADAAGAALDQRLRQAVLDHLAAHPHPTAASLARAMGLSHDYATRRFRAAFGMAPRAFLVRQRVQAVAQDLVGTSVAIADLAHRHGFSDVRVLERQFRRILGCTPGAWRRERRGG